MNISKFLGCHFFIMFHGFSLLAFIILKPPSMEERIHQILHNDNHYFPLSSFSDYREITEMNTDALLKHLFDISFQISLASDILLWKISYYKNISRASFIELFSSCPK